LSSGCAASWCTWVFHMAKMIHPIQDLTLNNYEIYKRCWVYIVTMGFNNNIKCHSETPSLRFMTLG
jgi:hypothetical protein